MTAAVETYAQILAEVKPRPIRNAAEYERELAVVETLMRRYRANLSQDLGDALDLVAGLIARYEADHFEMPTATPTEILNHLLAENGLDQQELAKRLKISVSHMSNVLNGTRQITVELARKLAQIFSRPATLFLNL
jgi:HTH-type transcriptional regulator/antitoxin HigA